MNDGAKTIRAISLLAILWSGMYIMVGMLPGTIIALLSGVRPAGNVWDIFNASLLIALCFAGSNLLIFIAFSIPEPGDKEDV